MDLADYDEASLEILKTTAAVQVQAQELGPEGPRLTMKALMPQETAEFMSRNQTLINLTISLDLSMLQEFKKYYVDEGHWVLVVKSSFYERLWLIDRDNVVLDYRKQPRLTET